MSTTFQADRPAGTGGDDDGSSSPSSPPAVSAAADVDPGWAVAGVHLTRADGPSPPADSTGTLTKVRPTVRNVESTTATPNVSVRPLRQSAVHRRRHRDRRRRPIHARPLRLHPLPVILVVQSGLALRLIWSNTAFSDESLYLWAGHLEWASWLHGSSSALPAFPTYFSGAPVIYPPLGALADSIGGVAGARLLALVFMLASTVLLYATAERLFDRKAAACGAALFAVLAPVQVLGAFAGFDPMAVFLIATATWLGVRAVGRGSEAMLMACGFALALADATKYASALWTPVVVGIVALAAPGPGWLRRTLRAARVSLYTAVPVTVALLVLGRGPYMKGVMFTTLARQAQGGFSSFSTVLADSFSWIGVVFLLALLGTVVAFVVVQRNRWVCVLLTSALVLAPLHQAQIHTTTGLHKHVAFGAWFGAMVAGYLLAKAGEVHPVRGWRVGAVAGGLVLFMAVPQASAMFVYGWPNTARMTTVLARVIPTSGCPCLVAQQEPVNFYLWSTVRARDVVGPYVFWYWNAPAHEELHGIPAYEQALRDHYFRVVEMDPAENAVVYRAVVRTIDSIDAHAIDAHSIDSSRSDTQAPYRLAASIPIARWGHAVIQIWTDVGSRTR